MPSHEALSVSPQGALDISSVVGQPPSLDRNHFSTPGVVAESHKRERCRLSSQRPQYPTLYRCLKRRMGHPFRENLYKGSVFRHGKKATHKCFRVDGGFFGPSKFQGPVSKLTSAATENSTVVAYINKQGGTHPDECSPVENHDLVLSLPDNLKSQTFQGV